MGQRGGARTSMGNLPPIHESWPAYAAIFLIPLVCGSLTCVASRRSASMTSRSCLNISGCWSYLLEMYCFMAADKARVLVLRNGRNRILLRVLLAWRRGWGASGGTYFDMVTYTD